MKNSRFLVVLIVAIAIGCIEGGQAGNPLDGQGFGGSAAIPASGAGGAAGSIPAGAGAAGGVGDSSGAGGGAAPEGGSGGSATVPDTGHADAGFSGTGTAQDPGVGGTGGGAGSGATGPGGTGGGTGPGGTGGGTGTGGGPNPCCPDGNCLCREPDPSKATSGNGPYQTASYAATTGTIYYPTDADPPFAGIALCGGFLNTGPEMAEWGPFYASYGIVTIITTTTGADMPDLRATKLLASIDELKAENNKSGSPLSGKMSDRYGISGYSMGGGGTTIGCTTDPSLKTGVGLAPWAPVAGMTVPTLFLCGNADTVAGVTVPTTASGTPSLQVVISGYTHFNWFGPTDISGYYALAWQKVFLEGDTRWKPLLSDQLAGVASMQSTGL